MYSGAVLEFQVEILLESLFISKISMNRKTNRLKFARNLTETLCKLVCTHRESKRRCENLTISQSHNLTISQLHNFHSVSATLCGQAACVTVGYSRSRGPVECRVVRMYSVPSMCIVYSAFQIFQFGQFEFGQSLTSSIRTELTSRSL